MGDKRIRCPDCHRLRVRTSRLDPDQCPRCEVRGELAHGRLLAAAAALAARATAREPEPEAEPAAPARPMTLRDRLEVWLWH